jgi:mannan polymerase II complex MNN10 subunit
LQLSAVLTATISGTPTAFMSLSRSPSPVPGGGWASPGLNTDASGRSSPVKAISSSNGEQVTWEGVRQKTSGGSGYPAFQTQNKGYFTRHLRRLSSSLPRFSSNATSAQYGEKEKLGRGRWGDKLSNFPLVGVAKSVLGRMGRKLKLRLLLCIAIISVIWVFYNSRKWEERRSSGPS